MKTKLLNTLGALALAILLSACSSQKPETISASVVTSNIVSPGSVNDFKNSAGDSVYFNFDKSDLSEQAQQTVLAQSKWLNQYPQYYVEIVGHCDERGTVQYNKALGGRRSEAVKQALIKSGVSANRIKTSSLGSEHPICVGSNEEAWALNRVAITFLTDPSGMAAEAPAGQQTSLAVIKNGQVVPTV